MPHRGARLSNIYAPLIRRWVRPYVAQSADFDDVVQEVLTTLVSELSRFDHNGRTGAFRAWLRAITVNRIRITGSPAAAPRKGPAASQSSIDCTSSKTPIALEPRAG